MGKCSCGRPYPLLKSVAGRTSDSILTPSGILLESIYLTSIFDDYTDYVRNFRIYQKEDYSVTVYVVLDKSVSDETRSVLKIIKDTLSQKVNGEIPISITCVDELKSDRGKNRYIISEVALGLNRISK